MTGSTPIFALADHADVYCSGVHKAMTSAGFGDASYMGAGAYIHRNDVIVFIRRSEPGRSQSDLKVLNDPWSGHGIRKQAVMDAGNALEAAGLGRFCR